MKGTYQEQHGYCVLQAPKSFSWARWSWPGEGERQCQGDGEPQAALLGWVCIARVWGGWLRGQKESAMCCVGIKGGVLPGGGAG